jgi:hypothetical protein
MNNIRNLILGSREAQQHHAKIMTKILHRIEIVQPNAPPTSGQRNSHARSANTLHNPKAAKDAIKEAMLPHIKLKRLHNENNYHVPPKSETITGLSHDAAVMVFTITLTCHVVTETRRYR